MRKIEPHHKELSPSWCRDGGRMLLTSHVNFWGHVSFVFSSRVFKNVPVKLASLIYHCIKPY
jgi:hypothetical protein